jgi:purine-nucleoside phosphorylase
MESFALFHTAKVLGKAAACLVSISDSFVHDELATAEQRQTALLDMLHIALGAV